MEALDASESLQDLGRHGGGQHVDALGVRRIRVVLLPVEEHPPSQQGGQLISGEHLPAPPGTHMQTGLSTTAPPLDDCSERHVPVRALGHGQPVGVRIRGQNDRSIFPLSQEEGQLLENRGGKLIRNKKPKKFKLHRDLLYQDRVSLLRVWAANRGEVRVGIFLLGDRNGRGKAEHLEGLLDEAVTDSVEGRVDELQRAAAVQIPEGHRTASRFRFWSE